jgi:hypothetical protein
LTIDYPAIVLIHFYPYSYDIVRVFLKTKMMRTFTEYRFSCQTRRNSTNDDDVDGVRLRILTAATNGPIAHEKTFMNIDRVKLLILLPEISGNPTSSHLVAKHEELEQ